MQEARSYGYTQVQFEFAFTWRIALCIFTISIQVVVFAFASWWKPSRHGNIAQSKGSQVLVAPLQHQAFGKHSLGQLFAFASPHHVFLFERPSQFGPKVWP
ncbi:MAG TPA: hypothetical protein VF135_00585 [Terriglobales bacterium]